MPRKRKLFSEDYNKPFPKNLRRLMEENETTQQELANFLNRTRQVISCYCDGSTSPSWETVADICRFFSVSADWLLGLSDVRTNNGTVRAVCDYTYLSEEAVEFLHSKAEKKYNDPLTEKFEMANFVIFSKMVCNRYIWNAIRQILCGIAMTNPKPTLDLTNDVQDYIDETRGKLYRLGYVVLDEKGTIDFYANQASENFLLLAYDCINDICSEEIGLDVSEIH